MEPYGSAGTLGKYIAHEDQSKEFSELQGGIQETGPSALSGWGLKREVGGAMLGRKYLRKGHWLATARYLPVTVEPFSVSLATASRNANSRECRCMLRVMKRPGSVPSWMIGMQARGAMKNGGCCASLRRQGRKICGILLDKSRCLTVCLPSAIALCRQSVVRVKVSLHKSGNITVAQQPDCLAFLYTKTVAAAGE